MTDKGANDRDHFRICLCSDIDYERLFAAVEYKGQEVALITQEEGRENLKLELVTAKEVRPGIAWIVEFDGFVEAVLKARERLLER
ncbi:hypothetical protein [Pelagibius sp.]|uniref:hypothetical protein n=1 Tax=Pelagibius sp. TaxID=1931238 RepID=UPI002611E7D8|nr:hypothetical protein [Pelagibius sp.]